MTSSHGDRPHRPAVRADLSSLIEAAGLADATSGSAASTRAEIAAATAAVVVGAGRGTTVDQSALIGLADRVGLDTLAELWRDADPISLPGALWAMYLLRQWCHTSGHEITRLWRAGAPLAPADAVVAGISEYADVEAVRRVADAVLGGAYRGDFAVALERAAAVFRVVAAGRRDLLSTVDLDEGKRDEERAQRNLATADRLSRAAALWRAGQLH